MKNKKNTITPNEINKYLYCPYQWYYERLYGRKEIYAIYKEKNQKLDRKTKGRTYSNFEKGRRFHETYYVKFELIKFIRRMIIICSMLMILYLLTKLKV